MLSGEGEGGSGSVVEVEARVLAFIVARRVRFGVLFVVVESCARSCGGLDGGCEAGGGGVAYVRWRWRVRRRSFVGVGLCWWRLGRRRKSLVVVSVWGEWLPSLRLRRGGGAR